MLLDDSDNTFPLEKLDLLGRLIIRKRVSEMAKDAGVTRQAAAADLRGEKPCPAFREHVRKVLGDIRWWQE